MPLHEPVRLRRCLLQEAEFRQLGRDRQLLRDGAQSPGARRREGRARVAHVAQTLPGEQSVPADRVELRGASEQRRSRGRFSCASLPVKPLRALLVAGSAGGELGEALRRVVEIVLVRHPGEGPARQRGVRAAALCRQSGEPRPRLLALARISEQPRGEEDAFLGLWRGGKPLRDRVGKADRLRLATPAGAIPSQQHSGDGLDVRVPGLPGLFQRGRRFPATAIGGQRAGLQEQGLRPILAREHPGRDFDLRDGRCRLTCREQARRAQVEVAPRGLGQRNRELALHRARRFGRRMLRVLEPEISQRFRRFLFASGLATQGLRPYPGHRRVGLGGLSRQRRGSQCRLAGSGEFARGEQGVGEKRGGAQRGGTARGGGLSKRLHRAGAVA